METRVACIQYIANIRIWESPNGQDAYLNLLSYTDDSDMTHSGKSSAPQSDFQKQSDTGVPKVFGFTSIQCSHLLQ